MDCDCRCHDKDAGRDLFAVVQFVVEFVAVVVVVVQVKQAASSCLRQTQMVDAALGGFSSLFYGR